MAENVLEVGGVLDVSDAAGYMAEVAFLDDCLGELFDPVFEFRDGSGDFQGAAFEVPLVAVGIGDPDTGGHDLDRNFFGQLEIFDDDLFLLNLFNCLFLVTH